MIDAPEIIDVAERPAAVIRFDIARDEISQVMGPGFQELMQVLGAQGIAPAGPFFSHHFRMLPDRYEFELGVPVAQAVTAAGRVHMSALPAARVARTVYRGGYEGLGDGWGTFMAWIGNEGLNGASDFWEVYLAGPETGPDATKYATELCRPLKA